MRPNRISWVLVGFFLLVGVVLTALDPSIWLGQAYIACAFALTAVYVWMGKRADRRVRLLREGVPGSAEILEVDQTGGYFNGLPRIRLRLRVHADGVAPFETQDTYTVPFTAVGGLRPGASLPVAVDPARPSRFAIDWR